MAGEGIEMTLKEGYRLKVMAADFAPKHLREKMIEQAVAADCANTVERRE